MKAHSSEEQNRVVLFFFWFIDGKQGCHKFILVRISGSREFVWRWWNDNVSNKRSTFGADPMVLATCNCVPELCDFKTLWWIEIFIRSILGV